MNNLKRLGAAIALTSVLGLSAFAGQILTPCPPPEPGQILTPCDPGSSVVTGDTGTPTGASTAPDDVTLATSETSFGEIAANVILTFLPLF
jgi:hypothetical protein